MTTVDGGCLALKNPEETERARKLRWFGLDKKNPVYKTISRSRIQYAMNNVNATIGLVQMRHPPIDWTLHRKRKIL